MKISLNWLKAFVDIQKTPEEIEQILTGTGLEVEHYETIESIKGGLKGLVVGKVEQCEKHPNADKLSLTKVDIGTGELLSIVCGAPNVAAGLKVIVAPVGTMINPSKGEPFQIKNAKIRGEASEGMLCAEDEIGMGESHAGLLILPETLAIGTPLSDYFNVTSDVVFEIGLTANRGDATSHLGVARELATVLNVDLNKPSQKVKPVAQLPTLKIVVEDTAACPRYSGLVMSNITVNESPDWLKLQLKAIGLNSINNVVDATNYVMHELGQPLHAFDYNAIKGEEIIVKRATVGEVFVALDDKSYTLKGYELMIANVNENMCIAGVYGGKHSGVNNATTKVFLESAYFSADVVRKSAKTHGINTDSGFRFERGTDPEMTLIALERVAAILTEIAGAKIESEYVDVYPEELKASAVYLRKNAVKKIGGFEIPENKIEQILKGLGIIVAGTDANGWQLEVPLFKSDVTREIDVVEELIRIYGFEHIPLNKHMLLSLNYKAETNERLMLNKASDFLRGMGFSEIMTNSLVSDKVYEDKEKLVYMANPLSAEMNVMRKSMLYSGLEAIAYNKNRKQNNTHFFEFGKTYLTANQQYFEKEELAIFASGNATSESWEQKQKPVDYYFLKSIVTRLVTALGGDLKCAEIKMVDEKDLALFDIKDDVYFATINWQTLISKAANKAFALKALPQFPIVHRDLSLVIDKAIEFKTILGVVQKSNVQNIIDVNVFDVYEGKPLEEGKKSISIGFELYDEVKTMNEKEIDAIMQKLIKQFEQNLNAVIRK
jgi:phenylalanyl-tRNA synthetase beta chain